MPNTKSTTRGRSRDPLPARKRARRRPTAAQAEREARIDIVTAALRKAFRERMRKPSAGGMARMTVDGLQQQLERVRLRNRGRITAAERFLRRASERVLVQLKEAAERKGIMNDDPMWRTSLAACVPLLLAEIEELRREEMNRPQQGGQFLSGRNKTSSVFIRG